MDKKEASQETQSQKNPDKRKKSASGIWTWILWLLFASVAIVVVIGVWYALKMVPIDKDDKMMSTAAIPEGNICGGRLAPIDIREIEQQTQAPTGAWQ